MLENQTNQNLPTFVFLQAKRKLKMFGFIKHAWYIIKEKLCCDEMYIFRGMEHVLQFANQKMLI